MVALVVVYEWRRSVKAFVTKLNSLPVVVANGLSDEMCRSSCSYQSIGRAPLMLFCDVGHVGEDHREGHGENSRDRDQSKIPPAHGDRKQPSDTQETPTGSSEGSLSLSFHMSDSDSAAGTQEASQEVSQEASQDEEAGISGLRYVHNEAVDHLQVVHKVQIIGKKWHHLMITWTCVTFIKSPLTLTFHKVIPLIQDNVFLQETIHMIHTGFNKWNVSLSICC